MALLIDPKIAEMIGVDVHLPPVPPDRLRREALIERFQSPPVWMPDPANERWRRSDPTVQAAVLVPLVMREEVTVLLTQRSAHLNKHPGQISFPGGRHEPADPTPMATALREAQEEIGLHPERVEVIGSLPTFVTGTGFSVTPVVGMIDPLADEARTLQLQADPNEVDDIFEVPLSFLMNPQFHERRALLAGNDRFEFFAMPWRAPDVASREYFIWGATAGMLRNLYRFLAA